MCKIDRVIALTKERRKKKVSRFIPLSIPNFEGNERKYVDDAIDQGWVSTGGAYITKLEEQMAGFLHVDRKSTRLNSSHTDSSRMPSSA